MRSIKHANIFVLVKEGKRLSKIIKQEGKVEKQALEVAINELGELQKIQKSAVKVPFFLSLSAWCF
jgi:hypothetical protein